MIQERSQNITGQLFLLIIFIILFDQVTKTWAYLYLRGYDLFGNSRDFVLIKNIFRLTYIENPGIAFGIRVGNEIFLTLFATISSILLLYILFQIDTGQTSYKYALGCIIGGAFGNLVDRFIYGKVIDFIYLEFINWPVFNVADIAVTIGMFLGIFQLFDSHRQEPIDDADEEKVVWINGEKISSDEVIQ